MGQYGSKLTGFGSYALTKNSLVMQNPPMIRNSVNTEGAVIISHREFLADIEGSTAFTIQNTFDLNPGLATGFPWLSQVANAFEEWEPQGMIVEFVSSSGNAVSSTNSALGEVILSTQYNSYAPPFGSKQEMLNQIFAVSTVPSVNAMHPIECAPRQNQVARFYTRNSAPIGDSRLYDLGRLSVATNGQQAVNTIGEIWITYQIAFYKPKLLSPGALLSFPQVHYSFVYSATSDPVFGVTSSAPILQSEADPFGLTFSADRLTLNVPQDLGTQFEVTVIHNGVSSQPSPSYGASFSSCATASQVNCTITTPSCADSAGAITRGLVATAQAGASSTPSPVNCIQSLVVNVTNPSLPWSITWAATGSVIGYPALPPAPGGDLYVSKLN
jgi:hypothetical protein